MKKLILILFLIIPFLLIYPQDTIQVPDDYTTIQAAINASSDGDIILVGENIYNENINLNGKKITLASLFLTTNNTSYISGTVIDGNNTGSVVTFDSGEDSTTLLCGFTIQNGLAEVGGGIFSENANPVLKNLIVRENSATTDGGGMAFFGSNVSLEDLIIEENNASEVGAGIYSVFSNLHMSNVVMNSNSAIRIGGGIRGHFSNLQIDSCTFINNEAINEDGGALSYMNGDDPGHSGEIYTIIINNSTFKDNTANNSGGIFIYKPNTDLTTVNISIDKCEFINNSSDDDTGLRITGDNIYFTLANSVFKYNQANMYAAGCGFSGLSSGTVYNCLFALNEAAITEESNSGGVSVWSGANVDFINCTFTDNTATYGSGLTVGGGGIASVTNCIFWGNSADQIALDSWNYMGGTLSVNYCDVQGGEDELNIIDYYSVLNWEDGNIDINPFFVDADIEDFHLSDFSRCIGSGTLSNAPTVDIEDNPRPDPSGSNPDMGAYENSLASPLQEPNIIVSDDSLDFGQVFLGITDSLTLEVTNSGTLDLLITSISANLSEYSVFPSFAGINPLDSQTFTITFSPQATGNYSGVLTINSNDPDAGTLIVILQGQGVEPPDITVYPDSLSEDLYTDQAATQTITIGNNGVSNLDFKIFIDDQNYALQFDGYDDYVELPVGTLNDLPSGSIELWLNVEVFDNEILYKETYYYETISGIRTNYDRTIEATHGNFSVDDDVVSNTLLAAHEWNHIAWTWDGEFQKIYINGELDNTHSSTDGVADELGVWLRLGRGDSYFGGIIDEFRIWNTPRSQEEIRLDMYREISGSEQNLIGYWNFNEGSGTTTFDQTSYNNNGELNGGVHWIHSTAPIKWLTAEPDSGSIISGSSDDITVTFDATGLIGGDYNSNIIISSNDPDEPQVMVPAHLYVTAIPNISLSDTAIFFENAFIGFPNIDTLIISNLGTDTLIISNINSDNSFFTIDTTNFNLNIREKKQLIIAFAPDTVGLYTGTLTIYSNDPDEPTKSVSLQGLASIAPQIYVSPDSLSIEISAGDTTSRMFTIFNLGGSDLDFDISNGGLGNNYALSFDGLNDYVRVSENSVFDLSTDLTIEAWINPVTTEDARVIVSKWNDSGPDFSYIFKIWNTSDKISIELSENNFYGDLVFLESKGFIPVNEWTHAAVTYNSNEVKLFFNGSEDNSTTASGVIRNSIADLVIGANQYGASVIENFSGLIDEVRIWSVARTESQIKLNMYSELKGDETGLVGYWRFNEGAGNIVLDQTVNGNNGLLQGGVQWISSTISLNPAWLSVDPSTGSVHAGDSLKVKLTCDATHLSSGNYPVNIFISSNDPDQPHLVIPVSVEVITGLADPFSNQIPNTYELFQNYPNPFNPNTTIQFGLPEAANVKINLYNVLGQKVTTLVSENKLAGRYKVKWDASKFASGIYFYRLEAGKFVETKKMLLLK